MKNSEDAQAVIQSLLNKVGILEYKNTLLEVENDKLKKQITNKKGDK